MIATLMLWSLIGWSYWVMFRFVRSMRSAEVKMPVAGSGRRATRAAAVLGLGDDPAQWLAAHGSWTALDERQLIRLLTDSAP
jgi:hypothetical protein